MCTPLNNLAFNAAKGAVQGKPTFGFLADKIMGRSSGSPATADTSQGGQGGIDQQRRTAMMLATRAMPALAGPKLGG